MLKWSLDEIGTWMAKLYQFEVDRVLRHYLAAKAWEDEWFSKVQYI